MILELGRTLLGGIIEYFKGRQEIKKAYVENKARLLRDETSNNHEWEMANLVDKDKWLRRISFALFSFPVVLAYYDPPRVAEYFNIALHAMPEWYIKAYLIMVGGIWGVSELKRLLPSMVGEIRKR